MEKSKCNFSSSNANEFIKDRPKRSLYVSNELICTCEGNRYSIDSCLASIDRNPRFILEIENCAKRAAVKLENK